MPSLMLDFCREYEGPLLSGTMRPEDAAECLLAILHALEAWDLNPDFQPYPDPAFFDVDDDHAPRTVANFAQWLASAGDDAQPFILDDLWSYVDELVSSADYTVSRHPDDPACIGLWPVEFFDF